MEKQLGILSSGVRSSDLNVTKLDWVQIKSWVQIKRVILGYVFGLLVVSCYDFKVDVQCFYPCRCCVCVGSRGHLRCLGGYFVASFVDCRRVGGLRCVGLFQAEFCIQWLTSNPVLKRQVKEEVVNSVRF